MVLTAFAQTATNTPPVSDTGGGVVIIPSTGVDFWTLGIAAVAPLIVGGIRKLVPKIPGWLLPTSTPLIGMGLGAILNYFGAHHFTWFDAAKAGALAVFVRETWNQAVTQGLLGGGGDSPKPPTS